MRALLLLPFLAFLSASLRAVTQTPPKKPEVGKPAPALRLNDHRGNIAELGGKRERWAVLAFFPKAATPG
jgi:hypothetical protein